MRRILVCLLFGAVGCATPGEISANAARHEAMAAQLEARGDYYHAAKERAAAEKQRRKAADRAYYYY